MEAQKLCPQCGETKQVSDFYRHKRSKDGMAWWCKECQNQYAKKWGEANREKRREYNKNWKQKNREWVRVRARKWREANQESVQAGNRRRNQKHRSTAKGKLNNTIGKAVWKALKGEKGGMPWEALVGYTVNDLMTHLEKHFQPGMTWKNMGRWHIDHKIPKAAFNYKSPEDIDFRRCWALKNLQPMWAEENLKKSARLERPFQPSLAFG